MTLKRMLAAVAALALAFTVSAAPTLAAGKPAPAGKVNVNTASAEQLTAVPGIGPKLAARIVEYRQKSGAFKSIQELMNVKGVGEKSFQKLQPHLTAGDAPARSGATK